MSRRQRLLDCPCSSGLLTPTPWYLYTQSLKIFSIHCTAPGWQSVPIAAAGGGSRGRRHWVAGSSACENSGTQIRIVLLMELQTSFSGYGNTCCVSLGEQWKSNRIDCALVFCLLLPPHQRSQDKGQDRI